MPQDISLLNTAIGPVMRGPSSSHSAAPYMIARVVRDLVMTSGEAIVSAEIVFDPSGSFAEVYRGQGSDEGFAAGLSGVAITSEAYAEALPKLLSGDGFGFRISIAGLERNDHPNRVDLRIAVTEKGGEERLDTFEAVSLGGGVFCVTRCNGIPISIDGTSHVVLAEHTQIDHGQILDAARRDANLLGWSAADGLVELELRTEPHQSFIDGLAGQQNVIRVRHARPTQAVVVDRAETLVGAAHLLRQLGTDGDLADYALEYECQRLQLPAKEVDRIFDERVGIMLQSVEDGFSTQRQGMKYLQPSARKVAATPIAPPLELGFLKIAIAAALSAMEQTTNRGVVCAAPTAGSAGIIPGTLYAIEKLGGSREQANQFLKVASLIGALFAVRGSYAAETGGCSVETGASAAMAAAGLAHHFGGTPHQVMCAASLCLMNTLGLVCDPVGGEVEIPCHARNVAGIGHVWSSVTAALAGFDAVIPFDELVEQTVKIGKLMHPDLRCTARGGCAATATALNLIASTRTAR